jgi:uncharacterized protein YjbJ (UPF0337 family)
MSIAPVLAMQCRTHACRAWRNPQESTLTRLSLLCRNQESKGKEKGEGMMDSAKGNVKEGAGKLFGDDSKKAEGKADQAKGDGKKNTAGIL